MSLNVKNNNINNKRLSRLQAIILKVLAYAQSVGRAGLYKRPMSRITAGLYGNGSLISAENRQLQHIAETDHPFVIVDKLKSGVSIVEGQLTGRDWIAPKFSVSFSRALRAVYHKGLIQTYEDEPIFTITEKGLAEIKDRKVKVSAQYWDIFATAMAQGVNACER